MCGCMRRCGRVQVSMCPWVSAHGCVDRRVGQCGVCMGQGVHRHACVGTEVCVRVRTGVSVCVHVRMDQCVCMGCGCIYVHVCALVCTSAHLLIMF